MQKNDVIQALNMSPHPEGGFYVESFRSSATVQTERGPRSASTAILFLLGRGDKSHLHTIQSEEVWHFYGGGPLAIVELSEETRGHKLTVLGADIANGQRLQHVVPANTWFGSFPLDESSEYSLVGCTVAPGFDFADFELVSDSQRLIEQFPLAEEIILKLTPAKP